MPIFSKKVNNKINLKTKNTKLKIKLKIKEDGRALDKSVSVHLAKMINKFILKAKKN